MDERDLNTGTRSTFDGLRSQITGLLGDLADHLEESVDRMVEDEIAAANAFADWKILTENEEGALTTEREGEVTALV